MRVCVHRWVMDDDEMKDFSLEEFFGDVFIFVKSVFFFGGLLMFAIIF